jgi:hypothetical protein
MYRSTFSWPRHWLKVCGQLHAPAALPQGKSPRYSFYKRLGGPQSRSGRYGEVKIVYPTGTRTPAPPGRPARSQSLYRRSYSGSEVLICVPSGSPSNEISRQNFCIYLRSTCVDHLTFIGYVIPIIVNGYITSIKFLSVTHNFLHNWSMWRWHSGGYEEFCLLGYNAV